MTRSTTRVPVPAHGIIPPMITPFLPDRSPDSESIASLLDYFVDHRCTGVLVLGSTGENGALSRADRFATADAAIGHNRGRLHVAVGLPALGLGDAVIDAAELAAAGADSLLAPPPFVFEPSPHELKHYYEALADAAEGTPLIAYDIPARTGVKIPRNVIVELAQEGVLAGVKDSSGDIEGHRLLAGATQELSGFSRFTGAELVIDGVLLAGFDGAVPGLANPFVEFHVALADAAAAADWATASDLQGRISRLFDLYFHPLTIGSFGANAVGALKAAMVHRGVIAHDTLSRQFHPVDDGLRAHAAQMLALADEIRP